jgi:hypothetical protein
VFDRTAAQPRLAFGKYLDGFDREAHICWATHREHTNARGIYISSWIDIEPPGIDSRRLFLVVEHSGVDTTLAVRTFVMTYGTQLQD